MQINETIRIRRKELNLTQEQIANYLGVTAPAVHKWEKGASFPDVSLLPALARLLQIDLNTLFSFETELSEQEIDHFLNNIFAEMKTEGFEKGYERITSKLREFPTCALLLYSSAAFLDGAIYLFAKNDMDHYENEIESLYERAVEYGNETIKDMSNNMLIIKYIKRKEFSKAEKLWETLPETSIDKKGIKATLCINQGKLEDAVCILEEKLCKSANETLSSLSMLLNCFQRMKKDDDAAFCAQKIHEVVDGFGFWEYQKHLTDFQMAVYHKDKEKTLAALGNMLLAMEEPFDLLKFPLYSNMKSVEKKENSTGFDAMKQMKTTFIKALKNENGLEESFLQDDAELAALLDKFDGKQEKENGCNKTL